MTDFFTSGLFITRLALASFLKQMSFLVHLHYVHPPAVDPSRVLFPGIPAFHIRVLDFASKASWASLQGIQGLVSWTYMPNCVYVCIFSGKNTEVLLGFERFGNLKIKFFFKKEFLLWCGGLRIQLQQIGSLQRWKFDPRPGTVG